MLNSLLKQRNLALFLSREEMLDILQKEEYGYLPPKPEKITFEVLEEDKNFCSSKAVYKKISAHCSLNGKVFSFAFHSVVPRGKDAAAIIVHIKFNDKISDIFMPVEEMLDEGFAYISLFYENITSDNADMADGLAGVLFENGQREADAAGKIAMWAWAVHRLMDYAQTVPELDAAKSVVCGHSRLGKTALLAGATDERFAVVYSNNSGCSGAALYKDKVGENIKSITEVFPYWFCENYLKYSGRDSEMPFDQHYLTACVAPRRVYIASAQEDKWADPVSEFMNCVAVGGFYEQMGLTGFVHGNALPKPVQIFHEGNVAYHLREGEHRFGYEDWQYLLKYAKKAFSKSR